jgi:hypothetical protein
MRRCSRTDPNSDSYRSTQHGIDKSNTGARIAHSLQLMRPLGSAAR